MTHTTGPAATRAALIFNPHAGQKLGLTTNEGGPDAVREALDAAGVAFDPFPTQAPRHATELAQAAAREGRRLVIAAGGDGTVGEAAAGLVGTETTLGVMPLGSIMNVARTLSLPRELPEAARVIAEGRVLRMDVGQANGTSFLEAGGVGLAAGLFGYFERLDAGARPEGVLRGVFRFLRGLGSPRLVITADGNRYRARAPMVTVANGPFVGAAYALAPDARIDDGLLDVVVFREGSIVRMLLHLLAVAGGRRQPPPPRTLTLRARTIEIVSQRKRPLPVHADGTAVGVTPAHFTVLPGALRVIVGHPEANAPSVWSEDSIRPLG